MTRQWTWSGDASEVADYYEAVLDAIAEMDAYAAMHADIEAFADLYLMGLTPGWAASVYLGHS